jgi:hypothetical protein
LNSYPHRKFLISASSDKQNQIVPSPKDTRRADRRRSELATTHTGWRRRDQLTASRDRLALASQAGSLSLALDAADTIQAQDGLEKMLVHQMAVLHYGMMRAAARMNEELDAAGVIDPKVAAGMFDLNMRLVPVSCFREKFRALQLSTFATLLP